MKSILKIIGLLILYSLVCYKIYIDTEPVTNKTSKINKVDKIDFKKQTEKIGYLKIDKINLSQPLYKKDSIHNNVEENITILKESIMPTEKESIVFLAAHSGTGRVAYFEKLNNINIGDKIELDYKGKIYIYNVINIWEEPKNGYIHINKHSNNQLILTTCSPENSNKQLVINSIEENKNTSKS